MPKKRTFSEAIELAESFGFTFEGLYINALNPVTFTHTKCGRSSVKNFKEFLKYDNKCVHCYSEEAAEKRSYRGNIREKFNQLENMQGLVPVDLEGDYTNAKSFIRLKHERCGKEISITWNDLQQGIRCGCTKGFKRRLTPEKIKAQLEDYKDMVTFIDSFFDEKKGVQMVKVRHLKCNSVYTTRLNTIKSGWDGCRKCRTSKGERLVSKVLDKLGYPTEREVKYEECFNKRALPFDFRVNLDNTVVLIEYDGIQHFESSYGDEKALRRCKKNDEIKNEFCSLNKIPLLRIKYTCSAKEISDNISYFLENVQRLVEEEDSYVFQMT